MDRRALLAIVLSFAVLAVWSFFFAPRPPQVEPAGVPVSGQPVAASGAAPGGAQGGKVGSEPGAGENEASGAAQGTGAISAEDAASGMSAHAPEKREAPEGAPPAIVETDFARVEIASSGGRITSWTLKKYTDYEGKPYELVSADSRRTQNDPLRFRLTDKKIERQLNTLARFAIERGAPGADAAVPGSEEVRLVYSDGLGLEATKTLVFKKDSYLVQVSATVTVKGEAIPGQIEWGPGIGTPSADDVSNSYFEGGRAIADSGLGAKRYYPRKVLSPLPLEGPMRWAGIEEQYFAAVFIPTDGLNGVEIVPSLVPPPPPPAGTPPPAAGKEPAPLNRLSMAVPLGETYWLFAGPKDYQLLAGLGRGLDDLVNFAPGVPLIGPLIGVLAKLLYAALRWLYSFIPNYGVAIILMTTAIKIIFYPVTQRTMVKMRGVQQQMQKVQPKVKAIREKYRKSKDPASRAKVNEEIMALYQREGINPMASLGGCLPLLLQLPILYGFYSVLTVSIELRQAPFFGWITDLSRRDPYYITPILMGISMFVQQKMSMTTVTDPQQRSQQRMMLIMPFIFTYTFLSLPSGLVVYWFVNNILGIAQQVLIYRQAAAIGAPGAEEAGRA